MIRIIIADDHAILRQGLVKLLKSDSSINIERVCGNGYDAMHFIRELSPDAAILDVSMPLLDGIEVAKKIRDEKLKTRVILLTMHKKSAVAKMALKAGASGYVLKDSAFEELLEAINCVIAGGVFVSPSLRAEVMDTSDIDMPVLTEREYEVLRLIVSGLTNKKIAEKLGISIKTVDSHRTNIMQKCDMHTTADLVRYAINAALVK